MYIILINEIENIRYRIYINLVKIAVGALKINVLKEYKVWNFMTCIICMVGVLPHDM